ncbi:MAG: ribosomal RNA small subunit methyltransferase A [Anaerolineae bacterium]|nr:ribosomal RNA small subunit methyltransferase A [Anaerolineae bacterium]
MTPARLPSLPIAALLREYDLRPKKSLGQNFLMDEYSLERIVAAAEVTPQDAVLEIGPGLGSLTRHLALAARRVVAVELDQHLIPPLRKVTAEWDNITIIHGDMLELDPQQLMQNEAYLVIANIPYYITSALTRHLLDGTARPARLVFTMQYEVAERICATEGKHSLLSLSVQVYGVPRIVGRIPAGAFYPAPSVDSAVLRVDVYDRPLIDLQGLDRFFRLAKAGFSQKRKNLRNSLSGGMRMEKDAVEALLGQAQIDPNRRAETLSLLEWKTLTSCWGESAGE